MKTIDIIIFGVSKVSQVVYSYIHDDPGSRFNVVGFCVDAAYHNERELFGLPIVAFEEVEGSFPPDSHDMLVAIGYHSMNTVRAAKCLEAGSKGYRLASYVHSKADVSSSAKIGKNCIILDNVSIEPFVEIGNNVCIYCNATVAHHAKVDENVWITSGTVVGGNSLIGKNCFLGINSTIGHNIKIGEDNFIGAGAVVTKSTDDRSVYIVPDTVKHRLNTTQFMKLFKFD